MKSRHLAAIDLGASSGRVMLAHYHPQTQRLELNEITRFKNELRIIDGHSTWDVDYLEEKILAGLHQIDEQDIPFHSIGIDTWGVDFVLLNEQGQQVGFAIAYRDQRTQGIMEQAQKECARAIYQHTGIQFLPFNTLYQLKALSEQQPELCTKVLHALLIPDYFHYRLTGKMVCEYTNATTTQLLNAKTDNWDPWLFDWAGVPTHWFKEPVYPGSTIGSWQSPTGKNIPVIAVATHDTASAVLATPLSHQDEAYLSSGTWSLMGFESLTAYISDQAMKANITNEGGIEKRYRVLKNMMGLWLFQRICAEHDITSIPTLINEVEKLPAYTMLINPNDYRFINPKNMTQEIQSACHEQHFPVPQTTRELTRCIFDSLALLYKQVLDELVLLRGKPFTCLHIVGGGSQNPLLNQLCADTCGIPVSTGPVEASTLGNIGAQLIALNEVADVDAFRQLIRQNFPMKTFLPRIDANIKDAWLKFQTINML